MKLLFTIPVSNAKLERMFSKLKIVKTLFRSSLSQERLECLLRIIEDGSLFPDYGPSNAIKLWMNEKVRRPNQNQCLGYKQRGRTG